MLGEELAPGAQADLADQEPHHRQGQREGAEADDPQADAALEHVGDRRQRSQQHGQHQRDEVRGLQVEPADGQGRPGILEVPVQECRRPQHEPGGQQQRRPGHGGVDTVAEQQHGAPHLGREDQQAAEQRDHQRSTAVRRHLDHPGQQPHRCDGGQRLERHGDPRDGQQAGTVGGRQRGQGEGERGAGDQHLEGDVDGASPRGAVPQHAHEPAAHEQRRRPAEGLGRVGHPFRLDGRGTRDEGRTQRDQSPRTAPRGGLRVAVVDDDGGQDQEHGHGGQQHVGRRHGGCERPE